MNEQPTPATVSWLQSLKVYAEPASLRMLSLGFSSGLPLLLVFGTLSFWLREAGIDRTTIGFMSWIGLAYAFKWAWSPMVDRLPIPILTRALGRRRSWLLLAQAVIMAALVGMALTAEAFDQEVPKGYIYAAMAFSLAVEALNIRARSRRQAKAARQP